MPQPKFQFLISLLVYTVIVRLLPYVLMNCDIKSDPSVLYYPWNFSPLTAVCLFGGAFLANRRLSFVLPLATLLISDVVIALVSGHPLGVHLRLLRTGRCPGVAIEGTKAERSASESTRFGPVV
jgi:hypothetical protein